MNAPQQPGKESRSIIAARWPEIAAALTKQTTVPQLTLYDMGEYPSILANGLRLASAWNPVSEALLQLQQVPEGAKSATLFGVGMGYLPLTAIESYEDLEKLNVVPLNLALFNAMLDYIDMRPWLQDPRVTITPAEQFDRLPANFAVTTPMLQLAESKAERLRDLIRQHLSQEHSESFQRSRSEMIADNIESNLVTGRYDHDVSTLFDSCRPEQAVVVIGAGPSLDLCLSAIRQLQDKGAILIAVDASLRALHKSGLHPDYVVTIDPMDSIRQFLQIEQSNSAGTSLVYFPSACPEAISEWPAIRYCATGTHPRFAGYRKEKAVSTLFSSGSVIHPATDLAVRMGTRHVIFAGADFGYPLDTTHAQNVPVNKEFRKAETTGYNVRNYRGEIIPSSMNLISYYRDLEKYITRLAPANVKFNNIGSLSARLQGVEALTEGEEYAI